MNDTITIPIDLARDILDNLFELKGERDWWKDEPRCNYQNRYEELTKQIETLDSLIVGNLINQ